MTLKVDQLRDDVEELRKLEKISCRPHVKDILSIAIRKLETEIVNANEELSQQASSTPVISAKKTNSSVKCYDVKITNYAWDQSDKFVKLFVTLKNIQSLDKEQISCNYDTKSVQFCARALENKNHILTIKGLCHSIDPSSSHLKVKTDSVVIFLAKAIHGRKWENLTASEVKTKPDLAADDKEDTDDPSASLMNMIKKMYDEGDDEMKRTIAKAWNK